MRDGSRLRAAVLLATTAGFAMPMGLAGPMGVAAHAAPAVGTPSVQRFVDPAPQVGGDDFGFSLALQGGRS